MLEIKDIEILESGKGYKWHNIYFSDFDSLDTTVVAAASLLMNEDPSKLFLCNLDDQWFVKKTSEQQAVVIPMSQVYAENGKIFPLAME